MEFAAAEEFLNEGLGCISELVLDTAAATHSLSCGTNDRDCNEVRYSHEALDVVESFQRRDTHREDCELVFV